jgi:sporulation protein YlmC with PRC-barrel domain
MADSRDNPDFLSVESLTDDKVVNKDGEDLGKFEDLMIDLSEGRIAYAALSFGGILGLGNKLFAIPWKALSLRVHEHEFVLDIPKEVLEKAEGFDKDHWPITTHESLSKIYSYYGYQPYWKARAEGGVRLPGHEVPETTARENSGFLRASKIQGEKVVNKNDDDLGKIEDLMVDIHDGKIAYAVISHGGILGLGSKHIAIPWQALSLRIRDNAFVVDIPKETIDSAEGLDKDKWPVTYEELSRTFSYYGFQPYWQTGAVAGVAGASAAAATGVIETERTTIIETERPTMVETEEERQARLEREKLEGLKETQAEKVARLEKERMEAQKQIETERDRLARLEKERAEVGKQAEIEKERLARLERELEEAKRQEKTEQIAKIEEELKGVRVQEQAQRDKLAQLEREQREAETQAETEKERLAKLEKERMEAEQREQAERERVSELEKQRIAAATQAETEKERLARLERERMEAEKQIETEKERLSRLEAERMEREWIEAERQPRMEATGAAPVETMVGPQFLSADTIKSDKVVNTAGEDLGKIEELMIDLQDGRIAYAVLSFGGFLGIANKLFAIPWQALKLRPHDHAFTLDIPKEVLERAEGFDKDNWPLTRDAMSGTYVYYGYRPYWQMEPEVSRRAERVETGVRGTSRTETKEEPVETAEERIARQEKERIEGLEQKVTDKEKLEELEKEKQIAERREHKYH